MLRHPFFLLFVCLALIFTAYDASAKARQTDTAEYSAKNPKAAQSKTAVSKKETAKAPGTSSTAGSAKKPSKKQQAQAPAKSNAAKDKVSQSRKQKKSSRDPASLPNVDEAFAEAPDAVLAMLSAIPTDGNISSYFGMRRLSNKTKRARMHTGIDITSPRGAPVLAAASGVVRFANRWSAYGRVVEIDHGNGLVTRYAHLDNYAVEDGAKVAAGEQVGTVGRSGRTTGSHLHFETLVNGRMVDPMMAEMWQQTPEQLTAKRGTYVSGLRAASKRFW